MADEGLDPTLTKIRDGGMTILEMEVMKHTINAWHAYLQLTALEANQDDLQDVRSAINAIQRIIAYRVAKRVDPEYWT